MSEEAFKDVSHSPVEPITREPKATSRDSFQALIAPTPPPGRREVNDGLMRPVPPINKQDRGIARDQSGRSFSRSTSKFGVVEDQGRIYNNDLFRETQVEDQNTNVNTLNKPMTNRNEEVCDFAMSDFSITMEPLCINCFELRPHSFIHCFFLSITI